MFKQLVLVVVASIPVLPLACSSTDKGEASAGGSGGASTAGGAGKSQAGNGGRGGDAGTDTGSDAGASEAGTAGAAGAPEDGGDSGAAGALEHAGSGGLGGSAGKGGTGGTAGKGGAGGTGGTAGKGGAGGTGGTASTGGTAGTGGTSGAPAGGAGGGSSCGALGQACCAATANSCNANLSCLQGSSCSCVKALAGQYVIRADGTLLYQSDPPSAVQTPVIYASSAQPVLGAQTVSQGQHHACAILADQSVWCWPTDTTANAVGQLGNGTTDASGPIFRASQVLTGPNAPLTKAASLSGVSSRWATNTCAVTTEGKLYCWGDLSYTAGGGTTTKSPYASVITSNGLTAFSSVLQVSADYANACAIVQGSTSKEVWCWGTNNLGQLGTGDTKAQQYPVKVLGISDPSQVVVSNNGYGSFACALDGSKVRCWGSNDTGQLGIGSTVASVPTPTLVTLADGVTPLSGIVQVEAAAQDNIRSSACALTSDHTILCWGNGFATSPALYGVGNVVSLGSLVFGGVRFLTSDGVYHLNTSTRAPSCAPI